MGSFFRSEAMTLCQLYIQPEAAYLTLSEFGELGKVHFRDLNGYANNFQRQFVAEIRRCEEMERRLRYIGDEVKKGGLELDENVSEIPRAPTLREISDLQAQIEKTEFDIRELRQNGTSLKNDYIEYTELRHILEMMQIFFSEEEEASYSIIRALITNESQNENSVRERLEFITGVVNRERMPAFERMLWRVSRGNVFLRQASLSKPLEDPNTGNEVYKIAFVVFFQGEQLKSRILKICSGFRASVYACPANYSERIDMVKDVCVRLEDLKLVLNQTEEHRQRVLSSVVKKLPKWIIMVCKVKAIFHTMNHFDVDISKKCLIGECWVPKSDLSVVQKCLNEGSRLSNSTIASFFNVIPFNEEPPTHNKTNKFISAYQVIMDAYGVASYREVNPALHSTITFPFLFAVMFGDLGHGFLMFLLGLYLVVWEKKLISYGWKEEMWKIFFGGRYLILLMGLFSMYTGLIYNEVFGKSINLFGSQWRFHQNYTFDLLTEKKAIALNPKSDYAVDPYLVGIDPVWSLAENKIIFLNSYKMKMSITFAVAHMVYGIVLSAFNFVHFKKYASLFLEFLPQLIFLLALFGYFVFLFFFKWIVYSGTRDDLRSERCAPSVLISFINMLMFAKDAKLPKCDRYMFPYQRWIQMGLVVVAVLCVPIILFGKPLHIRSTMKKAKKSRANELDVNENHGRSKSHEEGNEFSEIMIHQAIHTIEYVLSTVSHVASYLRLWALALAHAQLTEVIWKLYGFLIKIAGLISIMTKTDSLGSIIVWCGFSVFSSLTIGLVIVEGLSAFLHTLRLHWVEFMSKFYEGQGYPFQPFSFKAILDGDQDIDED